ncbi:hypothetical protein ZWY2020_053202 [Hordeum vulgare]|nr:hypothetical protein ZWY2020_053202 [Hordeum vulgare]
MAGRAPKQPPALTPRPGQGNRPTAPAPSQVGRPPGTSAQAGKPPGAVVQSGATRNADANRMQPRGRWGDDGVNAYGDDQHRGSSSSGGGRGYAWQNNGGSYNGFSAPPGKFVPGTSSPSHPKRGGFRQNWGGRGGGRKPRPPIPNHDAPADSEVSTMATVKESVKEVADPALADQSLAVAKGDGVTLGEYLEGAKTTSCRPCAGGSTDVAPEAVHGVIGLEGGAVTLAPALAPAGPDSQAKPVATLGDAVMAQGTPAGAGVRLLSMDGGTESARTQPAGDDDGLLSAGSGLCNGGGHAAEMDMPLCSTAMQGKAQNAGLTIDDDSTSLADSAFMSKVEMESAHVMASTQDSATISVEEVIAFGGV